MDYLRQRGEESDVMVAEAVSRDLYFDGEFANVNGQNNIKSQKYGQRELQKKFTEAVVSIGKRMLCV